MSLFKKAKKKAKTKIEIVMKEFKQGKLHSGRSGNIVTNPKQAIAIGISEMKKNK